VVSTDARDRRGNPDAHADLKCQRGEMDRLRHIVHDPAAETLRPVAIARVMHDDAELVAAEACDRATLGETREPFRDDAQHLIAEPVAIDVVDRLEIVEVDDEQRADLAPIVL
jgi:hypothetical protein